MTIRYFLCFFILGIIISDTAAASSKAKKKQKTHFALIEAYNKKMPVAEPGAPPMTGDHFVIKWNDTNYPETFFWRGESGWLSCKVDKVHKAVKAGGYTADPAIGDQVHKGDTLMLSPVTGGRFPIPKEIPTSAKNTLFYKTGGSEWLAFPVKTIAKKN